jgi:hypothetical protein
MNITFISIIASLVAVFYLTNGVVKFIKKENRQTFFKFFLTVTVWGGVILFSVFPGVTHYLSEKLGLGKNLNTLIFVGFICVFAVTFKILRIIERIERDVSALVRREALNNLKKK